MTRRPSQPRSGGTLSNGADVAFTDELQALDPGVAGRFERRADGTLALEAVVAERRTLLSRERLLYHARVRVDDSAGTVRFHEVLKETTRGLAGGLSFRAEATRLEGKERSGVVAERSSYLGRRYDYRVDYGAVRKAVESLAKAHGYAFEVVLRERSLAG